MSEIKKFPIVLTIDFHKQIKEAAANLHLSMNKFFIEAAVEKLKKEGE